VEGLETNITFMQRTLFLIDVLNEEEFIHISQVLG